VTTFSDAPETVPEQAAAAAARPSSHEESLVAGLAPMLEEQGIELSEAGGGGIAGVNEALARAAAQHRISVLSPVGARRTGALVALRRFAEALAGGDQEAARGVLGEVEAEPKGDAPAIAHVIGTGASVLDDWFTDAALTDALAVAPIAGWGGKPARSVARDLVGLARRGRAFGSLEALRRRRSGPVILEGVALGVAAAAAARASSAGAPIEAVLAASLVDDADVEAALARAAAQAGAGGQSFVRGKTPPRPRPVRAPAVPVEDPLAAEFEAWLAAQDEIAAPSVGDELAMLGKMRELGGLRGIDLGQPGAVAPFAELLREATAADTGELEQNALATLRDYAGFRSGRGDDAEAWEGARVTAEHALRRGAGTAALRRVLAAADAVDPGARGAALAELRIITGVGGMLDWIGRSKEVTEQGEIRAEDHPRIAELLGAAADGGTGAEADAVRAASPVRAWWTALSYAGIVETAAARARRGRHAVEWSAAQTPPLELAEQIVAIFVAETIAAPLVVGGPGGRARTTAAISQLLRIVGAEAGTAPGEELAGADGAGALSDELANLAAAGLLVDVEAAERSPATVVPEGLRGAVARGLLLSMELLTADASRD
jgi:hypothetical protein